MMWVFFALFWIMGFIGGFLVGHRLVRLVVDFGENVTPEEQEKIMNYIRETRKNEQDRG